MDFPCDIFTDALDTDAAAEHRVQISSFKAVLILRGSQREQDLIYCPDMCCSCAMWGEGEGEESATS